MNGKAMSSFENLGISEILQNPAIHHQNPALDVNFMPFCGIPPLLKKTMSFFPLQVVPNTFNYSALISSCGRAGQWQLAWELYQELFGLGTSGNLQGLV